VKQLFSILFVALALVACNRTSTKDVHVLDIESNAVWGENHAYSEWNGRMWEVSRDAHSFQAEEAPISIAAFDSISAIISADFGEPTYTNLTLPAELIPSADTGTFWMAWKNYNRFCYWCNDTISIGLGLFEKELVNDAGYAYLYIERLNATVCGVPVKGTPWELASTLASQRGGSFVPECVHVDGNKAYIKGWIDTNGTEEPYRELPYDDGYVPAEIVCDLSEGQVTHAGLFCELLEGKDAP
jgi:hypothetical protein